MYVQNISPCELALRRNVKPELFEMMLRSIPHRILDPSTHPTEVRLPHSPLLRYAIKSSASLELIRVLINEGANINFVDSVSLAICSNYCRGIKQTKNLFMKYSLEDLHYILLLNLVT